MSTNLSLLCLHKILPSKKTAKSKVENSQKQSSGPCMSTGPDCKRQPSCHSLAAQVAGEAYGRMQILQLCITGKISKKRWARSVQWQSQVLCQILPSDLYLGLSLIKFVLLEQWWSGKVLSELGLKLLRLWLKIYNSIIWWARGKHTKKWIPSFLETRTRSHFWT